MTRKQLIDLAKIVVSLVLIVVLVNSVELDKLKTVFVNANPVWLTIAFALGLAGIGVRAARWQILLHAVKVRVPLPELVNIYFIGAFFNNLLPSGLGGDAVRMMELNQHTDHGSDAVTSVVVDRLTGLLGSVSLACITLIFAWRAIPLEIAVVSVVIFVGIIGGGFVLLYKPLYDLLRRIGFIRQLTDIKFISKLFASFQAYTKESLIYAFLVGLLLNFFLIAINVFIGIALGIEASLAHYLIFVPLISLVLLLPITFAGLGTREAAYVFLFTQIGVPEAAALALSLLYYAFGNLSPGLVGGAIFLVRSIKGWQTHKKPPFEMRPPAVSSHVKDHLGNE